MGGRELFVDIWKDGFFTFLTTSLAVGQKQKN